MQLQINNLHKVGVITLCYIEIFFHVLFLKVVFGRDSQLFWAHDCVVDVQYTFGKNPFHLLYSRRNKYEIRQNSLDLTLHSGGHCPTCRCPPLDSTWTQDTATRTSVVSYSIATRGDTVVTGRIIFLCTRVDTKSHPSNPARKWLLVPLRGRHKI